MTTLDLKDAYLSVPVHKISQKFLQFLWSKHMLCLSRALFWLKHCSKGFYQSLGRTQMVAVEHRFGEWQSNNTSSLDLVHNDRCIQAGWGALCQGHRTNGCWSEDKRIRTQGRLLCLNILPKESVSLRGQPENGQHNSRRYEVGLPHNFNVATLEVVPIEEHSVVDTTRSRQTKHHCRPGIEGVQRQKRMEDKPFLKECEITCLLLACPPSSPST